MESNKNTTSTPLVTNLSKRSNAMRDQDENSVASDEQEQPGPLKRQKK